MMREGRHTVEAIRTSFEPVINNALDQNALFSGTTRMSLAIRNLLEGDSISYPDSVYISSMRSALHSIIITHDYISAIYLYLEDGAKYYSTDGGILSVANSGDHTWLQYYQDMPEELGEADGSVLYLCFAAVHSVLCGSEIFCGRDCYFRPEGLKAYGIRRACIYGISGRYESPGAHTGGFRCFCANEQSQVRATPDAGNARCRACTSRRLYPQMTSEQ